MERNQAHSGQGCGDAGVAVSTVGHTSAVASQKLLDDDWVEKCEGAVLSLGIPISRHFCPETPVAYVLILDGHAVAAKVAKALDPCVYWAALPLPVPENHRNPEHAPVATPVLLLVKPDLMCAG